MNPFKIILCFFCLFFISNVYADNCDIPGNDLTVPESTTHNGSINGYCNVTISNNAKVQNGGINADGNVTLTDGAIVANDITAGGNIIIEGGTAQNGNISAGGNITLTDGALVNNSVTAGGNVIIEDATVQNGSVSADGDITLKAGSRVNNNIDAGGNIIIEAGTVQNGHVYAEGNITLKDGATIPNGDVVADGVVYLIGDVSKQNGKICGKSGVDDTDIDDGSNISYDNIFVGEDCSQPWDGNPPTENICDIAPDLSNYKIEPDNYFRLGQGDEYTVPSGYDGLYVDGTVTLNNRSIFNGNIYATGDVELKNSATVNGTVYSEGLIELKQFAQITDGQCPGTSPPSPDEYRFEIITNSDALTCEPHAVTIRVENADGDLIESYAKEVTLKAEQASVLTTWSTMGAKGILTDKGNGEATYSFDEDDKGSATLGLSNPTANEKLTVTVNEGGISTTSEEITFHPALIKTTLECDKNISDTSGVSHCINTANKEFSLKLTAIKADESNVCESYNPSSIAFNSDYVTPNSSATEVQIIYADKDNNEMETTQPLPINSDPVNLALVFLLGEATVGVNYPDAGKININVVDVDNPSITGSAQTIVNPFAIKISNINGYTDNTGNPISNPSTKGIGDGFIRASYTNYTGGIADAVDTFTVTIQALIDCDNSIGCTSTAPNFYNGSDDGDVIEVTPQLVFPTSGELGTLYSPSGASSPTFKTTASSKNSPRLAYSEVGSIDLYAEGKNYLVAGNHINAEKDAGDNNILTTVGRFFPDYLALTADSFIAISSCSSDSGDFSYLGQEEIGVTYKLTAHPQGATDTTLNYDDSFGYPVAESFEQFARDQSNDELSVLQEKLSPAVNYYSKSDWSGGVFTLSPSYIGVDRDRTTAQGPFLIDDNSAIDYFIKLTGVDGEQLKTDSETSCNEFSSAFIDQCLLGDLNDIVHGRLQAGNGHGSEFQSIRTLVEATYFDGTQFVPFKRDDCTTLVATQVEKETLAGTENDITAKTNLTILNSPLISGQSHFEFSAPQLRGKMNYFIELHSVAPWLLDSGNEVECKGANAGLNDCIKGYVEFGLFRGNDRIIYRMQTFD
ncbi:hypothetical protein GCM10007916_33060 [Psychromonas marina]|uniref:DUF6701 domain-containing protein n=2 Tax=Psychromonas marina TaxID=88364 RepID=A0ABQ6E5F1_9GAMM|nr:hypothetical protein GCM10007916_33060 [Psychromonas marina]